MTKRSVHCDTCTCGLTAISWSDRKRMVDLKDSSDVANVVASCALDHSYDRPEDGIPHGIPREIHAALVPVVAEHLGAIQPLWGIKTVYMTDEQSESFKQALERVILNLAEKEKEQAE